jgi:hypothetical protein
MVQLAPDASTGLEAKAVFGGKVVNDLFQCGHLTELSAYTAWKVRPELAGMTFQFAGGNEVLARLKRAAVDLMLSFTDTIS